MTCRKDFYDLLSDEGFQNGIFNFDSFDSDGKKAFIRQYSLDKEEFVKARAVLGGMDFKGVSFSDEELGRAYRPVSRLTTAAASARAATGMPKSISTSNQTAASHVKKIRFLFSAKGTPPSGTTCPDHYITKLFRNQVKYFAVLANLESVPRIS